MTTAQIETAEALSVVPESILNPTVGERLSTVSTAGLGDLLANSTLITQENDPADRSQEIFQLARNPETYEVTVESDITLDDYRKETPAEHWALIEKWAEPMKDKTVVFVNPTMEGGGVAMMRPPLVHMLRSLGVDARWYVMEGSQDPKVNPYLFTKQMHNLIQRKADEGITDKGKAIHQNWVAENTEVLERQEPIQVADIIVIDDPQPTPLIGPFKSVNPNAKIIWRNHIDNDAGLMDDPSTPQGEVWDYLLENGVRDVDACVFHPDAANKFVPSAVVEKTYLAPATIEPNDDMNRELTAEEKHEGIATVNREIGEENRLLETQGRFADVQELVDVKRDRIVLIARFDESKGMDIMMKYGAMIRNKVIEKRSASGSTDIEPPQIVIVGNGSVDDPSGPAMLEQMRRQRREEFSDVKQDIILKRLKHNYTAINALMYEDGEAVLVGAQMSEAEGCETRITDWINHGVPVVVSNRGGMSLQIIEGESGTVLDYDKPDLDLQRGTEYVSDLMINRAAYQTLRQNTLEASRTHNKREYTTTANVTRWLRAFNGVLSDQQPDKVWKVRDMALEEAA